MRPRLPVMGPALTLFRLFGHASTLAAVCLVAAFISVWPCAARAASTRELAAIETLYRQGKLPSGQPLVGTRGDGPSVSGIAAACVTCHRRSGLGSSEGRLVVPPIIGRYLFRPHSTNVQDLSLPHVPGYRSTREPYTPQTLARAIRTGVDPSGRTLAPLMPRYDLDDSTMAALTDYLTQLTSAPVPGVTDDTLHFATIVTPDADPQARAGMLDVLTHFFEDKNAFLRGGTKKMQASREIEYRVTRRWQLHVWELTGPPDGWDRQLREHLRAEPVFAVISGLGGADWSPVHRFCEEAQLPCLFPNVAEPVVAESDFYPVYFSRGTLLEADLMAEDLSQWQQSRPGARRVVQIRQDGAAGARAAEAVERIARAQGLRPVTRVVSAGRPGVDELAAALKDVSPDDALVLWLGPQALATLPSTPPQAGIVLSSGVLGGLEQSPFPAGWRDAVHMAYPVDLPDQRRARLTYAMSWFRIRQIPVVAERVQTDTYIACGILSETLNEMLDSFVRDYLVERVETMISHRLTNGYYPRLSLAAGQRFGSKGGYMVRFADGDAQRVVAERDWTVP